MSTVVFVFLSALVSVFPGFGGSPWLLPSGGVPAVPLAEGVAIPAWFSLIFAALVSGGVALMLGYALVHSDLWRHVRNLRTTLQRPPRRRHRHA